MKKQNSSVSKAFIAVVSALAAVFVFSAITIAKLFCRKKGNNDETKN